MNEWRQEAPDQSEYFYVDGVLRGHVWFGTKRWWWSFEGLVKSPTYATKAEARAAVERLLPKSAHVIQGE